MRAVGKDVKFVEFVRLWLATRDQLTLALATEKFGHCIRSESGPSARLGSGPSARLGSSSSAPQGKGLREGERGRTLMNDPEIVAPTGGYFVLYSIKRRRCAAVQDVDQAISCDSRTLTTTRARPTPLKCKNDYPVLPLGEETAVQAVVSSIVWAFRRLKKPRGWELSARFYALHSVCAQLPFPYRI